MMDGRRGRPACLQQVRHLEFAAIKMQGRGPFSPVVDGANCVLCVAETRLLTFRRPRFELQFSHLPLCDLGLVIPSLYD